MASRGSVARQMAQAESRVWQVAGVSASTWSESMRSNRRRFSVMRAALRKREKEPQRVQRGDSHAKKVNDLRANAIVREQYIKNAN